MRSVTITLTLIQVLHIVSFQLFKVSPWDWGGGFRTQFYPTRTMPVVLDVGTDNKELRESDDYLGMPMKRLEGREYLEIVDEFMHAVTQRWPNAVVQFEDFQVRKPQKIAYHPKYIDRSALVPHLGVTCVRVLYS